MAQIEWTRASQDQLEARKAFREMYINTPIPIEDIFVNFGLYMRSSYLANVLCMDEIYKKILPIPGVIMEFGTWWGSNLSIFNNLRGVYEPYNYSRKVIGFDTFTGYPDILKEEDKNSPWLKTGNYAVPKDYKSYLEQVLGYHEKENPLPHKKKFDLVQGDVTKTLPQYLKDHPETIVAMAFLDLGIYDATKKTLETLMPRLVKGSVLVFDEINCPEMPGETTALMEVIGLSKFRIERSQYTPDRNFLIIE
jgi:hypothetical protein